MSASWEELPPELLQSIATKLTIYIHYIRFRAVCKTFRSSLPSHPSHLPTQLPWLLLPLTQTTNNLRAFFNLSDQNFHRLKLPQIGTKRCCGSSLGWLGLIQQDNPQICLLNPLTRTQIDLPSIITIPKVIDFDVYKLGKEYLLRDYVTGGNYSRSLKDMCMFIKKIVLSCSPVRDDELFVVVVILNETGELAYCKKGDSFWSMIGDGEGDGCMFIEDVVYYDGLFYTVNNYGDVSVVDLSGKSLVVSVILQATIPPGGRVGDIYYLVAFQGEIFVVNRYLDLVGDIGHDLICMTVGFDVVKLVVGELNWNVVRSLGDRMFFLGGNSSLCLLASDYQGCEGNCIYFTDDYIEGNDDGARENHDVGVFKLEDRDIELLPCWSGHSRLIWPPHIWITPSPC